MAFQDCRIRWYTSNDQYPPGWTEGVALARTIERMNRLIFPERKLNIAFIINNTGGDHVTVGYMESKRRLPHGRRQGLFLIHPEKARDELDEFKSDGATAAQARFFMAAHETRHRVQDLLEVKLCSHGFLRRLVPRIASANLPWRLRTIVWGKRRFLTTLQRLYPGKTRHKLRHLQWYHERDAEIIAYVTTLLYAASKSLRIAAMVLCTGTSRCPK